MLEIVALRKRNHKFDRQFCVCNGLDVANSETFVKVYFPEDCVWRTFKAKYLVRLDNPEDIISIDGFNPKPQPKSEAPFLTWSDDEDSNFKRTLARLVKGQADQIELLVELIESID